MLQIHKQILEKHITLLILKRAEIQVASSVLWDEEKVGLGRVLRPARAGQEPVVEGDLGVYQK